MLIDLRSTSQRHTNPVDVALGPGRGINSSEQEKGRDGGFASRCVERTENLRKRYLCNGE